MTQSLLSQTVGLDALSVRWPQVGLCCYVMQHLGTGSMSKIFRMSPTGQNYSEFHNVHPLQDIKEFNTIDPIKWNLLTLS